MNKDIRKYIANCTLCHKEKAKVPSYPLQMTDIPEHPFNKITIDFLTECKISTSGNKHILTIIDHLTGWLEAFPIWDKSADAIVSTFINHYLPVHMCLRYTLSDNGTGFKNQLMDQVLQQLSTDYISLHHATIITKGNLKYFMSIWNLHSRNSVKRIQPIEINTSIKYLSATEWHQTLPQCTHCFSCLWQRSKPTTPSPSRTNATLPRWSGIWRTQLRIPSTQTSYCKEEIRWQLLPEYPETMDRELPSFKLGNRVYFKNKQPEKWDLKCRPRYRTVHIEHDIHYLHIENQPTGKIRSCNVKDIVHKPPIEFWNIDIQFGRARKYINHPANLPPIMLNNWTWTPDLCK